MPYWLSWFENHVHGKTSEKKKETFCSKKGNTAYQNNRKGKKHYLNTWPTPKRKTAWAFSVFFFFFLGFMCTIYWQDAFAAAYNKSYFCYFNRHYRLNDRPTYPANSNMHVAVVLLGKCCCCYCRCCRLLSALRKYLYASTRANTLAVRQQQQHQAPTTTTTTTNVERKRKKTKKYV